jgi:hypothetical protein
MLGGCPTALAAEAALTCGEASKTFVEAIMNPFNRLPGSRTEPPGMERRVLRALPAMLALGTMLPALYVLGLHLLALDGTEALLRRVEMARYVATGAILLNLMVVLQVAMLAGIVVLMKGHAYVADAYVLPDSAQPRG